MSYSTAQLDALRDAVARGVLEAALPDGSRVRYRSLDDMLRLIGQIEQQLGAAPNRTNVTYPSHRRGFHD